MKNVAIKTFYGSTALYKGWCEDCKGYYFVLHNELQCCDKPFEKPERIELHRDIETGYSRKHISKKIKDKILNRQKYGCFYCGQDLFEPIWSKKSKRYITRKYHIDHLVPWSYSGNDSIGNLVASCSLCNNIKSNLIFDTMEDARNYVLDCRKEIEEDEKREIQRLRDLQNKIQDENKTT